MSGQLNSLHRIAVRLGISPRQVETITRELGIVPSIWLDERPYYSDEAVEAMRERVAGGKSRQAVAQ